MSSVVVRNVTLQFGAVEVLKQLNLEVGKGEFLVLLGPSGCGKSTLLNCIAGLLDISAGQIIINGRNVTWAEPKDRGIGMVFQSYALYPQMSVEGNLSFGLKNAGLPREEIALRVKRASEILQIEPLLNRRPAQLSGGQRQRVAIGRALVRDVEVFLFDEPLSNLDAKLRAELRVELKRLHQRLGNTMIYVTHDQFEAMTLADRIAVMKSGVIQQLDAPRTIFDKPRNLFVGGFIGSPAMNVLSGDIIGSADRPQYSTGEATIALAGYRGENRALVPGRAVLGIRPEHVVLGAPAAETVPAFEATVEIVETMGTDSLVWLSHAGKPFSARVAADKAPRVGERLPVNVNIALASLFDQQSELRL